MNPWSVPSIDVADLPAGGTVAIDGGVLLDVREPDEWQAGHIDGALHVPMNSLPQRVAHDAAGFGPDARVVVVCKMGGRSAQVTAWLNQQGYDAMNLEGGMLAWAGAGRPMVAETGNPPTVL